MLRVGWGEAPRGSHRHLPGLPSPAPSPPAPLVCPLSLSVSGSADSQEEDSESPTSGTLVMGSGQRRCARERDCEWAGPHHEGTTPRPARRYTRTPGAPSSPQF